MLKRRTFVGQLFPSYLLLILLAMAAVMWYAFDSFNEFYFRHLRDELEARALLAEKVIENLLVSGSESAVEQKCREIGHLTKTRITIIRPDGVVVGDSEENPIQMSNHADRPEIREALNHRVGVSVRLSPTLKKKMMYVAVPLVADNHVTGVVRTSLPMLSLDAAMHELDEKIILGGILIALAAVFSSFFVARRINRPLEEVRQGALRFAKGELSYRMPLPDFEEIGTLAQTMNQMAAQLEERISTITRQRNELEAVLSGMVEAVLVLDAEERLIRINEAAGKLLGLDPVGVEGRSLQEMVRNPDLHRFIARTFSSDGPVMDSLMFFKEEERYLEAHGALLYDAPQHCSGALIVLYDVTRLKKLENIRRDFVANVSHELKTPITSIKGFVETLRDGAIDDQENAKRFLEIISRQVDRLNSILEDLLALSRLEQEAEQKQIPLEKHALRGVIDMAMADCAMKAHEKNIIIDIACEEGLSARINAPLLEQAVVNLLDNAIKYSDSGSRVLVEAKKADGEVALSVTDHGLGIPREHLSRIFERFYRVDKARSRNLGGTGLGLAIVKHIVSAHQGRVSVESTLGEGSVFSIHLPALQSEK